MSLVIDSLKTQLGQLPVAERVELASFLLRSLEDGLHSETDAGWEAEMDRRYTQVLEQGVTGIPVQMALEQLRRKYQ